MDQLHGMKITKRYRKKRSYREEQRITERMNEIITISFFPWPSLIYYESTCLFPISSGSSHEQENINNA